MSFRVGVIGSAVSAGAREFFRARRSLLVLGTLLIFTNAQIALAGPGPGMPSGCDWSSSQGGHHDGGFNLWNWFGNVWNNTGGKVVHAVQQVDWGRVGRDAKAFFTSFIPAFVIGAVVVIASAALIAAAPVWGPIVVAVVAVAGLVYLGYQTYQLVKNWNNTSEESKFSFFGGLTGGILGGLFGGWVAPGVVTALGIRAPVVDVPAVDTPPADTQTCFPAGTLVRSARGLVPIEEIHPGDMVLSGNPGVGQKRWQHVLRTFVRGPVAVLTLLVSVRGRAELVSVTPEHRFWVQGQGWIAAGHLEAGKQGLLDHELRRVDLTGIEPLHGRQLVYNLEVETDHTYFVGSSGVWVHNLYGPDEPELDPVQQAVVDAKSVYDSSSGLKALSKVDPNDMNQVWSTIRAVSDGAKAKYGVNVKYVSDDYTGPDIGSDPARVSNYDPSSNTLVFRTSLLKNPPALYKAFVHQYGKFLLSRFYGGKANIPNLGYLSSPTMLDYLVTHDGQFPPGFVPPPGAVPRPGAPPPPVDLPLTNALTGIRNAQSLTELKVLYDNATREYPVGDNAAQVAKAYQETFVRLATDSFRSAATMSDLRDAYYAAAREAPNGDTSPLVTAFEERANQILQDDLAAMNNADSSAALKKAWRAANRDFHPDAFGGQGGANDGLANPALLQYLTEAQKKINSLYDFLLSIRGWK